MYVHSSIWKLGFPPLLFGDPANPFLAVLREDPAVLVLEGGDAAAFLLVTGECNRTCGKLDPSRPGRNLLASLEWVALATDREPGLRAVGGRRSYWDPATASWRWSDSGSPSWEHLSLESCPLDGTPCPLGATGGRARLLEWDFPCPACGTAAGGLVAPEDMATAGADECLGFLPGLTAACCGHGDVRDATVTLPAGPVPGDGEPAGRAVLFAFGPDAYREMLARGGRPAVPAGVDPDAPDPYPLHFYRGVAGHVLEAMLPGRDLAAGITVEETRGLYRTFRRRLGLLG